MRHERNSKTVSVRSAVSSFFEICDRTPDGKKIENKLQLGARGGGFVLEKGTNTTCARQDGQVSDIVFINGTVEPKAKTTLDVVKLIRNDHKIPFCVVRHDVFAPIGMGFGTSGSGALGAAIAISDFFNLNFTLAQAAAYAHVAEIESVTGLGTVISLASGSGPVGLVTEPGTFSVGRVDSLIFDYEDYCLVCACFGPIAKSTVLQDDAKKELVNRYGREAFVAIMDKRTPESLLGFSRVFAEKTRIASKGLLKIADRAIELGALGATQNMIGNVVHCLVERKKREKFLSEFSTLLGPTGILFESDLSESGPKLVSGSNLM